MVLHRTLLLVVLVVLSGCLGAAPSAPTSDTTDEAATATQTPTPPASRSTNTSTTSSNSTLAADSTRSSGSTSAQTEETPQYGNCNASLHVGPAEDVPDDATVVDYDALPADRRAEFDQSHTAHATFPEQTDAYSFWVETRYVRVDDETFATAIAIC